MMKWLKSTALSYSQHPAVHVSVLLFSMAMLAMPAMGQNVTSHQLRRLLVCGEEPVGPMATEREEGVVQKRSPFGAV